MLEGHVVEGGLSACPDEITMIRRGEGLAHWVGPAPTILNLWLLHCQSPAACQLVRTQFCSLIFTRPSLLVCLQQRSKHTTTAVGSNSQFWNMLQWKRAVSFWTPVCSSVRSPVQNCPAVLRAVEFWDRNRGFLCFANKPVPAPEYLLCTTNFYSTPHQTPSSRSCRVASRLKGLTRREKVKRGRNAVLTLLPITRSTFKRSCSKSTKTIYIALPNYVFKLICQNWGWAPIGGRWLLTGRWSSPSASSRKVSTPISMIVLSSGRSVGILSKQQLPLIANCNLHHHLHPGDAS